MSPDLRALVVEMATHSADLQIELIEENYLGHEAFDPRPSDEASLQAAWESFLFQVDEPWWHTLEALSDEVSEEDYPEARDLLVETFSERILGELRTQLGIEEAR